MQMNTPTSGSPTDPDHAKISWRDFVHLHVHSQYSVLDGGCHTKRLPARLAELGMDTVGLSDHGTMGGLLSFYLGMKDAGIKPIIGCLPAGHLIETPAGAKPIEDIEKGDLVFTHEGRARRVTGTMKRPHKGALYGMRTARQGQNPDSTVWVTEEHPVLVWDGTQGSDPQWVRADEVKGGRPGVKGGITRWNSYAVVPKALPEGEALTELDIADALDERYFSDNDGRVCRLGVNKYEQAVTTTAIATTVPVTTQLARLLGLFVAEGHLVFNSSGATGAGWTFHIDEGHLAQEIVDTLEQVFGVPASIRPRPDHTTIDVLCSRAVVARWLHVLCGRGAHNKRVPECVWSFSDEHALAFLDAFVEGDGRITDAGQTIVRVASRHLAWGIRRLITRFGFFAQVGKSVSKDDGRVCHSIVWSVDPAYRHSINAARAIYVPIREVEQREFDGYVYNFEVEEDHSYLSGIALHNCEIYMADDRFHKSKSDSDERTIWHLGLIAKTTEGYYNMCEITSRAYMEGFYSKPRADWDVLADHSEGIIALTGCMGSPIMTAIFDGRLTRAYERAERLVEIFGAENVYGEIQNVGIIRTMPADSELSRLLDLPVIETVDTKTGETVQVCELSQHQSNHVLVDMICKPLGLKYIATGDCHYLREEDANPHDALVCVSQPKKTLLDEKRFSLLPNKYYMRSAEEMMELLPDWPEALAETRHLANRCDAEIPIDRPMLPQYIDKPDEFFHELIYQPPHKPGNEAPDIDIEPFALTDAAGTPQWDTFIASGIDQGLLVPEDIYWGLKWKGVRYTDRAGNLREGVTQAQADSAAQEMFFERLIQQGSSRRYLRHLCEQGMVSRYGEGWETGDMALARRTRLEFEFNTVDWMGFIDYFLWTWDIYAEAERRGIAAGPGRGCLAPDTPIITGQGVKLISDVSVGDRVVTHTGAWADVERTYAWDMNPDSDIPSDQMLHLRSVSDSLGGLRLTAGHEVWAVRSELAQRLTRGGMIAQMAGAAIAPGLAVPEVVSSAMWPEQELADFAAAAEWMRADQIEPGDYVFVPRFEPEGGAPASYDLADSLAVATQQRAYDVTDHVIIEHTRQRKQFAGSIRDLGRRHRISRRSLQDYKLRPETLSETLRSKCEDVVLSEGFTSGDEWREYLDENTWHVHEHSRQVEMDEDYCRLLGLFMSDGYFSHQDQGVLICEQASTAKGDIQEVIRSVWGDVRIVVREHERDVIAYMIQSRVVYDHYCHLAGNYAHINRAHAKRLPDWCMQLDEHRRWALLEGLWQGDGTHSKNGAASAYDTSSPDLAHQVHTLMLLSGVVSQVARHERLETSGYLNARPIYRITTSYPFDQRSTHNRKFADEGAYLRVRSVTEIDERPRSVHDLKVAHADQSFLTTSCAVHNSGAGSLMCYALTITQLCPIEYDLLFERFLNPDRISMPDLDMDFSIHRRVELIEYTSEKCNLAARVLMAKMEGKSIDEVQCTTATSQIITYGVIRAKAAIKDAARVLGHEPKLANSITKLIPAKPPTITLEKALEETPDLRAMIARDSNVAEIVKLAFWLEGFNRNESIHAAGVVIYDRPLETIIPLQQKRNKDGTPAELTTGYEMKYVEMVGALKMDFLGLRNLDVIEDAIEKIRHTEGIQLSPYEIPVTDPKTYEMLSHGDTAGVFQVECVAGDTIINGDPRQTIRDLYEMDASKRPRGITSVDLGEGRRRRNKMLRVVHNGQRQLLRMVTAGGYVLRATAEHEVLTGRGFQRLGELTTSDSVLTNTRDASRIGACPSCLADTRSHGAHCHHCVNIKRDSGPVMAANRDHDVWLASLKRGADHPNWGKEQTTAAVVQVDGLDHAVRSHWEADFALGCNALGIDYQYEPDTFRLADGSSYTPDFYLPDSDTWIEIKGKGRLCGRGKVKVDAFRAQYPDHELIVLSGHQIAEFELRHPQLAAWNCPQFPEHFDFDQIISIELDKVEDVYDIVMQAPLNNYVANGIVVHNSSGMQSSLRMVKPTKIEDINALVALYRPGPMKNIPTYAARKHGHEEIVWDDERLKGILGETYGICTYQEQLMQMTKTLANFTAGEADNMRKAVGKKLLDKMNAMEDQFVRGCVANGITAVLAKHIWARDFLPAADYSFNKCLAADTPIHLADGSRCRLDELHARYEAGEAIQLLAMWPDGQLHPHDVSAVTDSGERGLLAVMLADGSRALMTGDHRVLTSEGYLRADQLVAGSTRVLTASDAVRDSAVRETLPVAAATTIVRQRLKGLAYQRAGIEQLRDYLTESAQFFLSNPVTPYGTHADFLIDDVYWKVDSLDYNDAFYRERYRDLPYRVVAPEEVRLALPAFQCGQPLRTGQTVLSIEPAGSGRTFDVEMDFGGPRNFIAGEGPGLVSHNSHAACYGRLTYITAYLKRNHPHAYMASLLSSVMGTKDKGPLYLQETRRMGLSVLPPDVNRSLNSFTVIEREGAAKSSEETAAEGVEGAERFEILVGLRAIKSVGDNVIEDIKRERESDRGPFRSFHDFVRRMPGVNKTALAQLVRSGALDGLGMTRRGMFDAIEEILEERRKWNLRKEREFLASVVALFGERHADDTRWQGKRGLDTTVKRAVEAVGKLRHKQHEMPPREEAHEKVLKALMSADKAELTKQLKKSGLVGQAAEQFTTEGLDATLAAREERAEILTDLAMELVAEVPEPDDAVQQEDLLQALEETIALLDVSDWASRERLQHEYDVLGIYISGHPLDEYAEAWARYISLPLAEISGRYLNQTALLCGVVTGIVPQKYKGWENRQPVQKTLYKIQVDDFSGSREITFFNEISPEVMERLVPGALVTVKARIKEDTFSRDDEETNEASDEVAIKLDGMTITIWKPEEVQDGPVIVQIPNQLRHQAKRTAQIETILDTNPGDHPVVIHLLNDEGKVEQEMAWDTGVNLTPQLMHQLRRTMTWRTTSGEKMNGRRYVK